MRRRLYSVFVNTEGEFYLVNPQSHNWESAKEVVRTHHIHVALSELTLWGEEGNEQRGRVRRHSRFELSCSCQFLLAHNLRRSQWGAIEEATNYWTLYLYTLDPSSRCSDCKFLI